MDSQIIYNNTKIININEYIKLYNNGNVSSKLLLMTKDIGKVNLYKNNNNKF